MCLVLKNGSYQDPWEATLFSEAPMFARHNQPCNPPQNLKTTILSSGLNSYETNSNAQLVPVTHAPNVNKTAFPGSRNLGLAHSVVAQ